MSDNASKPSAKVLAVIPARSGSKGIVDKNIRPFFGRPLITHSIEQALAARSVTRVVVSTDSMEYAKIAKTAGAEVPFIRPLEFAQDSSLDVDVFVHALECLREHEGYEPDILVHLRPTHPIRDPKDIDAMVGLLIARPELDSVRSVSDSCETPYKTWLMSEDGELAPVAICEVAEAYNAPRQSLPKTYHQNACIDVVRASVVLSKHSMTGQRVGGYYQKYAFDIDNEVDFARAEVFCEFKQKLQYKEQPTICVDIDGIIASKDRGNDYAAAAPIAPNIQMINHLFERGLRIVLFTARGSKTGIDWTETTKGQLKEWGVRFSELRFEKPYADYYVDDRNIDLDQLSGFLD
jgi:CMP-N-acetylneuraminic acid synthetase